MHDSNRTSLNAVRVFATAARHESLSLAAEDLFVTPGAVSRQIKNLETELGIALFRRSNNAIALTRAGRALYSDVAPAIAMIDRSVQALRRDANEIVLRVSTTFAVRRLIPALDRFRRLYPDARVRIETDIDIDVPLGPHADAAICYRRPSNPNREGELLISDRSIPVLAPSLLARSGYQSRADVTSIPALQCTADNWDWMYWAEQTGVDFKSLRFENAFDNDDAALHAAAAGLGMVLSPVFMIREALASGALVALSDFPPVAFGRYHFVTTANERGIVRKLRAWLCDELSGCENGSAGPFKASPKQ